MRESKPARPPRFYFALPRLLALLQGGDGGRWEGNAAEAWFVSIAIFFVVALALAEMTISPRSLLAIFASTLLFLFLTFLASMILFYLNSLAIRLARFCGLGGTLSNVRLQSIIVGALTTLCALELSRAPTGTRLVGLIWLVLVTANLLAAAALRFFPVPVENS